jgi:hypothetical protein
LRFGASDLPADGSLPAVTWAGSQQIDRLILVGTPSFGAMDAMQNLLEGFRPALFLPRFDGALLCTMPAIYQLLPRSRHGLVVDADHRAVDLDLFDPAVWERNGWGLAAPQAERVLEVLLPELGDPAARRARALQYQAWCLQRAKAFHAALDQKPPAPPRTEVHLYASDTEPTIAKVRVQDRQGRLAASFTGADLFLPGDATVPRYSLIADERQGHAFVPWVDSPVRFQSVTFLADNHVGLTQNPLFTNNMLFQLLERRPPPME